MSLVFPVPPNFPQPNWIDDMIPGESAVVSQTFANQSISRLKISELEAGAEFTAHWNELSYQQVSDFLVFWRSVGTWESFTLPAGFWHSAIDPIKRNTIIALSPTGLWQFKEKPKFVDYNLSQQAIIATLRGVID